MDKQMQLLVERQRFLESSFPDICSIVDYLNRKINVEKLPDHIRNMNDAYNEIQSWNNEVEKALKLQDEYYKQGMGMNFNFYFERFLIKFNNNHILKGG